VLNAMTDRQLVEAYAGRQDCRALGVFITRHEAALLSFATAFLRNDTLAQDIVQETFLRVARNPQRMLQIQGGDANERNWLLKVVRDLSIDSLRRRATERKAAVEIAAIAPTTAPAADALAEAQEEVDRVRAAIDRLPPRLRELVILKVRQQKSYKEIAAITGLTVTNVGFLLHQAMKALGKELRGGECRVTSNE
jgi:RNA polymerase sigma-70 factor (ECF subfamily)